MRFVELSTRTNDECDQIFPRSGYDFANLTKLCTQYNREGDQMRSGDSGGPLVINGKLVGVNSLGHTTLQIFTRVSYFTSWIDQTMENELKMYLGH